MSEGPLGGPRPFATTNLKYDVTVDVNREIFLEPPKAIDLFDMRVNAPQMDSNEFIKKTIGDVLLAVNRLAHPSRIKVVREDFKEPEPGGVVTEGKVEMEFTYIIRGQGMGKFANTSTTAHAMWKAHEVLEKENDEPIKDASKQREFKPGPYSVRTVAISTE